MPLFSSGKPKQPNTSAAMGNLSVLQGQLKQAAMAEEREAKKYDALRSGNTALARQYGQMSITHKKQAQIYTQQMIQMDKTKSVVHSGQVQMQVAGAINNASTAMGVINQQIQNTNITSSINQFQEQERKLNEINEGMQQAMGTDNCYQEEDINQYMMNMQAMAAVDLAPRAAIGVPAAYQQPAYQQPVLAQPYGQPQQQQQPPQYQYQPPPQQQQQQYGQLNPPPFQPQQQQPPSAYPPPQFNPGMGGGTGVTGGVAPSLDDLERRLNNLAK